MCYKISEMPYLNHSESRENMCRENRKYHLCARIVSFVVLLSFTGCDKLIGPGDEDTLSQYSFSYKIFDEAGELHAEISDKQINGEAIRASAGYFGSEFFPPWLLENSSESLPIDTEDLKKKQIHLHAEPNLTKVTTSHSLRFSFPGTQQWETGEYRLRNISKEKHLELLRFMWETRQRNPFPKKSVKGRFLKSNETNASKNLATIDYSESGFMTKNSYGVKIDSTGLLYQSLKGTVELTHVSDEVVEGDFTVELAGFPMNILFFSDEFPENPELQLFTVTGKFTTIPGDYYDLAGSTGNQ